MLRIIKSLLSKFGINKTIFYLVLTRGVQSLGLIGSLVLSTKKLSSVEQGFYYTFISIGGIQILFEMGMLNIIVQFLAHEFAIINNKNENEEKIKIAKSRVSSFVKSVLKRFIYITIILTLLLIIIGFVFFRSESDVYWKIPWILYSIAIGLLLFFKSYLAILDGIGYIENNSKIRFLQQIFESTTLILLLYFDKKLYSLGVASLVSIIVYIYYLTNTKKIVWQLILSKGEERYFNWKKEILPYQSNMAVSSIAGYIIFQLFTPLMFKLSGPVEAGKFGLSLNILTGINTIAIIWLVSKVPQLTTLIALRERATLDKLFKDSMKKGTIAFVLGCILYLGIVMFLNLVGDKRADRFLEPIAIVLLSLAGLFHFKNNYYATYIRCHKIEIFTINTIITAILVLLFIPLTNHFFSNITTCTVYLVISVLSCFSGKAIYLKFKENVV